MAIPVKPTVPPVPQRTQAPALFSNNVDAFLTFMPTGVDYFDESTTYVDGRAIAANNSAVAAALSETNAAASELAAQSVSSFKGLWSSLTGAINKPATVYHKGAYWALVNNLANVALSEPSVTADWLFSNGTRWSPLVTAGYTLNANQLLPVLATATPVDLTQPTFAAGDFVIIHNSPASTNTVRILNPSRTILGKNGTVIAGDNLVLAKGDAVHLYARTSTILEVI